MGNYIQSLRGLIGHRKFIHPAARILIENEQGEILLIRRKDTDQWGLIAGGLEEGEDISACIKREVKEETGLILQHLQAIGLSTLPARESVTYPNGDQIQYFSVVFYSKEWKGKLLQETDETREAQFFPIDQLPPLPPNEFSSVEWLQKFKQERLFILE
ncbi:MAG: NUDIX domain-containing protein [Bacteroidota bacterium]